VISRNVGLRNELDLFINVLHCKSYPGVTARHKDIDVIIVRQNTEGEYAMLEHEVSSLPHPLSFTFPGVLEALIITKGSG
jgi:isocitrate/isopropylmalate dehydrogenase